MKQSKSKIIEMVQGVINSNLSKRNPRIDLLFFDENSDFVAKETFRLKPEKEYEEFTIESDFSGWFRDKDYVSKFKIQFYNNTCVKFLWIDGVKEVRYDDFLKNYVRVNGEIETPAGDPV